VLPGVRGGSPLGGYRYEVRVTDHRPYRFQRPPPGEPDDPWVFGVLMEQAVNTPGTAVETVFAMPRGTEAYPPCFAWRAMDPAGHTVEGPPVCLEQRVPVPAKKLPTQLDWRPGAPEMADSDFFGCAASGPTGIAPLALLGLMAALLRRARRG
jgi:uncharacterized protein (TIGR03382 family)